MAVDAGVIMIKGELSGQGLYASRVAIPEALMTLDPIRQACDGEISHLE